jgi:hypothetical protein
MTKIMRILLPYVRRQPAQARKDSIVAIDLGLHLTTGAHTDLTVILENREMHVV